MRQIGQKLYRFRCVDEDYSDNPVSYTHLDVYKRQVTRRIYKMVTNDATILKLKHDVLYEVAKLAWEDQLVDDKRDELPGKMIPGPQAHYRCCIYKEREVIRQRVRLAEGKCPTGRNTNNVVQVINAACEECPIASYTVTDNCRKCMGKACQSSCPFGAITMGKMCIRDRIKSVGRQFSADGFRILFK